MWNTDAFGWQQGTDPLYKSIPFFVGLLNGRAYGLFLDNTYKSSFDFGKEASDSFHLEPLAEIWITTSLPARTRNR